MKKYLIFDLDGTLIQSNKDFTQYIANFMADTYNLNLQELLYFFSHTRGTALRKQIESFMNVTPEQAKDISEEIYKLINTNEKASFFPGVPEKIKELHKKYTLFLSTGNSTAFAKKKLTQAGIIDCFSYILGSDVHLKGKPHIDIFKDYIGDSELEKYAIFIGDGQKDREIAKSHSMEFIHIDETGENQYNDKYNIKSVVDIISILKILNP